MLVEAQERPCYINNREFNTSHAALIRQENERVPEMRRLRRAAFHSKGSYRTVSLPAPLCLALSLR